MVPGARRRSSGADGKLAANPNKTWKQVNAALPDWPIAAYIPGEKHGTREVFEEKVLARWLQGRRRHRRR